jgi:hypothetical protein
MPYVANHVSKAEVDRIAKGLEQYYAEAWEAGVKGLFDKMAQSQMGIATKYLDSAKDSWVSLTKKSSDSFRVTFKADLESRLRTYLANKSDVMIALVGIGEKLIDQVASKLPVPGLKSAIGTVSSFAAGKLKDELHKRSITEADKKLAEQSQAELQKMFSNDKDALACIDNSMKQYKTLTNFIGTIPPTATNFNDAITFPKSAFKVQQAASSLNVSLVGIRQYLEAMSERLVACQDMSTRYIADVRTKMPGVVESLLENSYNDGKAKGSGDLAGRKYAAPGIPRVAQASPSAGGATLLANAMAHALAQGYYDAGNTGPMLTGMPKMPPQLRPRA